MPLLVRGRLENDVPLNGPTSSCRTDVRLELLGGGMGGGDEAPKGAETPTGDLGGRTGGVMIEDRAKLALEADLSKYPGSGSEGVAVAIPMASEEKLSKCIGLVLGCWKSSSTGDWFSLRTAESVVRGVWVTCWKLYGPDIWSFLRGSCSSMTVSGFWVRRQWKRGATNVSRLWLGDVGE